jgi:predicted nucleic acid-binding protein
LVTADDKNTRRQELRDANLSVRSLDDTDGARRVLFKGQKKLEKQKKINDLYREALAPSCRLGLPCSLEC